MRIEETGKNYINELSSFINSKNKLFVLSGSAGTGKTTLINDFSNWLEKKGFIPVLLATTGRLGTRVTFPHLTPIKNW